MSVATRTRAEQEGTVDLHNLLALEQEAADLDASRLLGTLRRRWLIALLIPVAFAGLGYAFEARHANVYEATAYVVLRPTAADTEFAPVDTGDADRELDTETLLMNDESFATRVSAKLGRPADYRVAALFHTSVISITGRGAKPEAAAETANVTANLYVAERRDQIVTGLNAGAAVLTARIAALQPALDQVNKDLGASAAAAADVTLLARQRDLTAQITTLRDRLSGIEIGASVTSGGARVSGAALPSKDPVSPKPRRTAVLFGLLGVLVGVGAAIVVEKVDDVLGSADDLERRLRGVPVLASVPALGSPSRGVLLLNSSQSASAEAVRTLRTSMQFLSLDRPVRRIQLTSAVNDEGASVIAANLAVAFAGAGLRVAVVDGDLRQPSLHQYFGVDGRRGFTTVLVGQSPLDQVLQPVAMQGWLRVLAAGPRPTNPSELLASGQLKRLLTSLEEQCDLVIIDSPPVLPYTDASVIASFVDTTVLVVSAGASKLTQVQRALRTLRVVGANVSGVVVSELEPIAADAPARRDSPANERG